MPHYRYQVCKGQKVLALSTTKREAEDEARRVGGHVEELPEKNPADQINPSAASQLTATQQKKYLGTLTGKAREARAREILYRREHRSDKPFKTDEGRTTKHSSHAAAFERKYGRAPHDTADAARLSGVSKKVLDEVYARGMAAWQTGHRPGASQHAWAMARVESFLTGGPTSKTADADLARKVGVSNPASPTHIPPAAVAAAARKGLEMRASQPPSNRCCTSVGLRRAAQLANRQPVSEDTMRRVLSYFQRHEVDKRGKDWGAGSRGEQAWLAWGGDPGFAWVKRVLGEPSRNPVDQTETPEFKRWFGNSKVVDAQGKPLVVYHGTKAQFTAFDKRYVRDQLGFHFGTKGQAKRAPSGKGKGSHVDPYWLSIQNPLRVRDEGSWTTEAAVDAINRASGLRIRYGARDAEIVLALQAAGYDGIVYSNRFEYGGDKDFGVDSWIAFEPTQIKSANHNKGTFDPHDADIRNPGKAP